MYKNEKPYQKHSKKTKLLQHRSTCQNFENGTVGNF